MGKKFLVLCILCHPHLDMGMLLLSHHYLAQVGWWAFFVWIPVNTVDHIVALTLDESFLWREPEVSLAGCTLYTVPCILYPVYRCESVRLLLYFILVGIFCACVKPRSPLRVLLPSDPLFKWDKYTLQCGKIHFAIWTNIFLNSDKYMSCWLQRGKLRSPLAV